MFRNEGQKSMSPQSNNWSYDHDTLYEGNFDAIAIVVKPERRQLLAASPALLAACQAWVVAEDAEKAFCRTAKSGEPGFAANVVRIQKLQKEAAKMIRDALDFALGVAAGAENGGSAGSN